MKSPQAFRSIGEVAALVGVATHVLRYWETQFTALAPVRRPDGRRYYRPGDLLLAAGLCEVMREDGLTIRGARRLIELDKGAAVRERGRLRLQDTLPQQAGAADPERADPESVSPESYGMNGDAMSAPRQRVVADSAAMPDSAPLDSAPLIDRAASPTTSAAMDGHSPTSTPERGPWLDRLTATATVLRHRSAPLPPVAMALAQALHTAWARRS